MRGKDCRSRRFPARSRITPAYAGKSFCDIARHIAVWDHPRICGEKNAVFRTFSTNLGSPPHMRGKAPKKKKSSHGQWITPAYAGKRRKASLSSGRYGDHPRICGEKKPSATLCTVSWGSPPHMRGKVLGVVFHAPANRITPAYAGKRMAAGWRWRKIQDHPRICGEKTKKIP